MPRRPVLIVVGLSKVIFRGSGFAKDEFKEILSELILAAEEPPEELEGFRIIEVCPIPDRNGIFHFKCKDKEIGISFRDLKLKAKLAYLLDRPIRRPAR